MPQEAPFHAALLDAILVSVAPSTTAVPEMHFQRGHADVVIFFPDEPPATWIFEVGVGSTGRELTEKLEQAHAYLPASSTVTCCAVLVGDSKPASVRAGRGERVFAFAWSQREGAGKKAVWKRLLD